METKDLEKEQEEQLKLKVGSVYIHNKTSDEYIIVNITKMKHPDTGRWIPAVIYYRYGKPDRLWCRSVESFKTYFSDAKVEGDEVYL
nr:MAG: protein of unknown function DUF1653 [Bacteriophage sp.]